MNSINYLNFNNLTTQLDMGSSISDSAQFTTDYCIRYQLKLQIRRYNY